MPWVKGQTGNPRGRRAGYFSLAERIRQSTMSDNRMYRLLDQMWEIALGKHDDMRGRMAACEWIAKHGWPDEARGQTTISTSNGVTTVTHVHQTDDGKAEPLDVKIH